MSEDTIDGKWLDKPEEPEAKRRKPSQAQPDDPIYLSADPASCIPSFAPTSPIGVRVPVDTLNKYIHELEKTAATAEKAIGLFRSAIAAFEEQQTALNNVVGDLKKLL